MKKTFLIIGSNSFSGSQFVNFLLENNNNVLGVSRSDEINEVYLPYKWDNSKLKDFKFFQIDLNKNLNELNNLSKPEIISRKKEKFLEVTNLGFSFL